MELTDVPPRCARPVLTGVVAYVEVWSSSRTENYSKSFTQQLIDMGAKVSKTFNKQVTHVIFKEGLSSTWNRAQKAGIKLVSVLWVEKCREAGAHVDESLYPAINTNEGLSQFFKKHKCMQPKDVVRKAPENDKRLQKRIDVLTKELAIQKAATETDAPVLLFKDDGSLVYSPASKIKYQCRAMEKRIKEMKEKRENLSPTASQMSQGSDSSSNPAMHESILVSTSSACALSSGESSDHLNSSFTNLLGNSKSKNLKKESSKCVPEVEGAREVLGSSPVYAGDPKHTTLKESSGKHLRNTFCLEDGLLPTMAKAEMSSAEKHSEMKDCFTAKTGSHLFQTNNEYRLSSEKLDHLEFAESSSNYHINSESELPSVNQSLSLVTTECSSTGRKPRKPRRRSRIGLNTSVIRESDSQNEFLKSVLTPVKCAKDQDTSFEDYFSPSNGNKHKSRVSLPFQCLQKSQSPEPVLQGSSKTTAVCSKKRKRVAEINENTTSSDCMLSVLPWSKESETLKCMSKRTKGGTEETPDCLPKPSIQEKNSTPNINRCFPTTGGDNLSMDEVKDGSCEFLCDQVNEPSEKLMSTGRLKKPSRTLVMTSMPSEKQNVVVQVVKKLGGFLFSDEVRDNTSHVIAGSSRRTLNILMGIARGCWILCYEWVLWSLEYGHWMSEEPYELSVDFPAAPICRFQRYLPNREVHQKLFSNHPAMFISPASQPPYKKLCELVQLCGGKVCKTPRQAKICIGEYRVRNNMDIQCLSEKWILDSVTQNKICPPENYKFQSK
ncbi:microcephalin [Podarcis raffonei]|uniref:microcephalin n=1 Tax=Podarcis raffonei TaxID=65483 RepID=UPI002329304A|nr:microcephalin [Podarcis raffonei]